MDEDLAAMPALLDTLLLAARTLLPGNSHWPSASDEGLLFGGGDGSDPVALPASVSGFLRQLEEVAQRDGRAGWCDLDDIARTSVMGSCAAEYPTDFESLRSFIYERYYSSAVIRGVLAARTGFLVDVAVNGVGPVVFEDVLMRLADVGERPRRVRSCP